MFLFWVDMAVVYLLVIRLGPFHIQCWTVTHYAIIYCSNIITLPSNMLCKELISKSVIISQLLLLSNVLLPEHNMFFVLCRLSYGDVYVQQVRAGHVHC